MVLKPRPEPDPLAAAGRAGLTVLALDRPSPDASRVLLRGGAGRGLDVAQVERGVEVAEGDPPFL